MDLDNILKQNSIQLKDEIYQICLDGINLMKTNPDPHHAYPHIENLLIGLNNFLNEENEISRSEIDFNTLLPSICWHDVWKGSKPQTTNLIHFVFREAYDGRGSEVIFKKYKKEKALKISKDDEKKIRYCIRKHARWSSLFSRKLEDRLMPVKLLEAKILSDIDGLDAWNLERIEVIRKSYIESGRLTNPKLIVVGKWWVFNAMLNANDEHYFFESSRKEFTIRKRDVMSEIYKIWNSIDKMVDVKDPDVVKYMKVDLSKIPDDVELRDYYKEYYEG